MKKILLRNTFITGLTLLTVILAGGTVSAQGFEDRVVVLAQQGVRERILSQERARVRRDGGGNPTVFFNNDAQTTFKSRGELRVRGTGILSHNDSRYDSRDNNPRDRDSRYDGDRSREFSYEAIVANRNRNNRVSGIKYDWKGDWSSNRGRGGDDNWRRNNRDGYGVNNRRDGYGVNNWPNGHVSYSGPITNRHSDKVLDVYERSNRDGAHIQQWSYADQPNQNWEIIDLGNREVAIISRQSGKALTVRGGRDNNGANVIQDSWNGGRQQRWRLEEIGGDYYRIISIDNGKCLDVTGQSKENGANIQLWDYSDNSNQQWRLRR